MGARTEAGREGKERHLEHQSAVAIVELWPTPTAQDDNKSPEAHLAMKRRMGERDGTGANRTAITSLAVIVQTIQPPESWPTPGANDHKGSNELGQRRGQLDEAAENIFPSSPQGQDAATSGGPSSDASPGSRRRSARARLSPEFVEWLQGLPPFWTVPVTLGTDAYGRWGTWLARSRRLVRSLCSGSD